jgi:membrane protein
VQNALALLFTVCAVIAFLLMLALAVAVPLALHLMGLNGWMQGAAAVIRWILLWCFAAFTFALIYRFAPAREQPRWRWLTVGSVFAATLWLAGTLAFSFYVGTFGNYQRSYGALSSVVVLLMWFLLSSFAVVLGAEVNAESERQTRRDSTTGSAQPMGRRGAFAADTLGPPASQHHH